MNILLPINWAKNKLSYRLIINFTIGLETKAIIMGPINVLGTTPGNWLWSYYNYTIKDKINLFNYFYW